MKTAGHDAQEKRPVIGTVQCDGKKREAGKDISNNERSLQLEQNDVGGATRRRKKHNINQNYQKKPEWKQKLSNKAKIKANT